jgi:transcription initiation factor TFIIIB Brf1 subunit/transcription initiation factor TFIIB
MDAVEKYNASARQLIFGLMQYETIPQYALDGACTIFNRLVQVDPIRRRGTVLRSVSAACVYYALRRCALSKTPAEIRELFRLERKQFTRGCRLVLNSQNQPIPTGDPVKEVYFRFGNQLGIKYPYLCKNWEFVATKGFIPISGTPPTVAASLLLLLVRSKCLDQPALVDIANVTRVSSLIIENLCLNLEALVLESELDRLV